MKFYINKVLKGLNIITSHAIYKEKANDHRSVEMKARIAPHGNIEKDRDPF